MKSALSTVAALLLLTGCGGGGSSSVSPSNSTVAAGALSASVSVRIPGTGTTSKTRKPAYLTSYTQGIDLQAVQNGTASGYVFYPLSQLQSYCTSQTSGYVCTLKVMAPPGNDSIVVNTYDNTTKATSNVLSTGTATGIVGQGLPNAFSVTTLPIVANINAFNNLPNFQCPTIGTPVTVTSAYTSTDADGGVLSGPIGSPFSAANTDQTGSVTFSPGPFTTATGSFTMTYNGGTPTNGVAVISGVSSTINAQGVANGIVGSGSITPLSATPAGPHYLYIADTATNTITVYDVCGQSSVNTINLPAGTNPLFIRPDTVNLNPPRIVVAGGNNTLLYIDVNSATVLQTVALSGQPHHIIEASTGRVLVTVDPNEVVRYTVHPSGPPYLQGLASMTVGNGPRGLNFVGPSPNPTFYVVNSTDGTVSVASISTMTETAPRITVGGSPTGVGGNPTSTANATCMLVDDHAPNGITSIDPTTNTVANTIPLAGSAVSFADGENEAPGSSLGSTTLVAFANSAQLVTCSGATVTAGPTWSTFPSGVTATTGSRSLYGTVFIAGFSQGQGAIAAFNLGQNIPLWISQVGLNTIAALGSGP